jgi:cell division protein FtsI (penicillin-binding protein 3)
MEPLRPFSAGRAVGVFVIIALLLTTLMGRVVFLQTYGRQETLDRAERQQHTKEILLARRGAIFDSTGMLMAGTVQDQTLFLDPKFMQECFQAEGRSLVEMDEMVAKLANIIDRDSFEISLLIGDRSEARFVKIAEHLDEGAVTAIEKLEIPGVGFVPTNVRYYPMGAIASHLLGGMQKDGIGLEGLELKFEKQLAGKDGFKRTLRDFRGRPLAVAAEDYIPPQHGQHLILTIDANIQLIAEQELARACEEFRAAHGEVVIMDPKTGDVLAVANWPTFNPQNIEDSTPEIRRNRSLTDPYEPGSVIKPFIVGPAMAWNITRPNEIWPIHGPTYKSPLRAKVITDVHGYDSLSTWDVLVKSSNIGMTMIGERMKPKQIHSALVGFGFNKQTGIDLPGENGGYVRPVGKWGKGDVVAGVQGYALMVTPIQIARAFCAFANGGRLVEPRIVKGRLDAEGNIVSRTDPKALKLLPQAVDEITATAMKRILCDTVVRGTATRARSKNWNFFGKTGTAHIARNGNYEDRAFNSSFIGGAPAENPRLVIAMTLHEPDKSLAHYGGTVSAPAAGRILERSLAYMQIPGSPDLPPPPPAIANTLYAYNAKLYADRTARAE